LFIASGLLPLTDGARHYMTGALQKIRSYTYASAFSLVAGKNNGGIERRLDMRQTET
jgi:hypothetical protein